MDCNLLSFYELDEMLEPLGIEPTPDEILEELESTWNDMPFEFLGGLSKVAMLLAEKGAGDIDYSSFRWVPSSARVFSFDIEALDGDFMYTMLLMGIAAIGRGELMFEDVNELASDGGSIVEFSFKGRFCSFESSGPAGFYDLAFLDYINALVSEAGLFNSLRFMSDGYEKIVVFYADEIWAQRFKKLTGYRLFTRAVPN